MEELTEVITAAEFHPHHCNVFVYSSSKGTIRLCDMRSSALCDRHSKCESGCAAGFLCAFIPIEPVGVNKRTELCLSGKSAQVRGGSSVEWNILIVLF